MVRLFVVLLAVWAVPVAGQDVPRLYDVMGVEVGDVLNIREAPSPSAPILATLPPDATGIEVTARTATRRWARVNTGEGVGWVSTRFIASQGRVIDNYNLPVGLSCFGTEPFWSLTSQDGALHYSDIVGADQSFEVAISQDTGIDNDLRRMIRLSSGAVAFLQPAQCSDGMSDRMFALSLSFMAGPTAPLLTGCCSLAP